MYVFILHVARTIYVDEEEEMSLDLVQHLVKHQWLLASKIALKNQF